MTIQAQKQPGLTSGISESIFWYKPENLLPADDRTVLIFSPFFPEPVWLGYLNNGFWFVCDGSFHADPYQVLFWAYLPTVNHYPQLVGG